MGTARETIRFYIVLFQNLGVAVFAVGLFPSVVSFMGPEPGWVLPEVMAASAGLFAMCIFVAQVLAGDLDRG